MEGEHCQNCKYYFQHYTFNSRKLFQVHCGHCTYCKVKSKRPDSKACEHFALGQSREDAFVSKEYLSKELLRYILSLELLPKLGDKE